MSVRKQSDEWILGRISEKVSFEFRVEKSIEIMDGDSGDDGRDELRWLRREKSEEDWLEWGQRLTEWSKKLIPKASDACRNEQFVIFKEEDQGGREMVTTDKQRLNRKHKPKRLNLF